MTSFHPPFPFALRGLLVAGGALLARPSAAAPPALRFLEDARGAVLVVLGSEDQALARGARQALRSQEVADLDLGLLVLDPGSRAGRAAEVRAAVPGLPPRGWGLLTPAGILLGTGPETPRAPELARLLASAGIKSPIKVLQAFLRSHPTHAEARGDLLRLLRRLAAARTRARLDLVPAPSPGSGPEGPARGIGLPDLKPYEGRRLGPVEDLEIWGAYGQELDKAFQDGSWLGMDLGMDPAQDPPLEVCSPTLQALYVRHVGKVEQAIATLPGAAALWQDWLRMTTVAGVVRSRVLVQGLTVPPPEFRMAWPPAGVVAALVGDAERNGDWRLVRDILEPFRQGFLDGLEREKARKASGEKGQGRFRGEWGGGLSALLEAMIRLQAEAEASELVSALASLPETRPLAARAAALATACRRQDLARRWAALGR